MDFGGQLARAEAAEAAAAAQGAGTPAAAAAAAAALEPLAAILLEAAHGGKATEIENLLLASDVEINCTAPGTGDTPLIVAAANGRLVAVQVLLAHGCDVDAASNYDWTALDAGVKYGHTAVVQTLKAADARHYADTVRDL